MHASRTTKSNSADDGGTLALHRAPLCELRTQVTRHHPCGALVQWRRSSDEVRLIYAAEKRLPGEWVCAARLECRMGTHAAQLTVLHPDFRVYVDSQRVLRLYAPVEVRAAQYLRFGRRLFTTVHAIALAACGNADEQKQQNEIQQHSKLGSARLAPTQLAVAEMSTSLLGSVPSTVPSTYWSQHLVRSAAEQKKNENASPIAVQSPSQDSSAALLPSLLQKVPPQFAVETSDAVGAVRCHTEASTAVSVRLRENANRTPFNRPSSVEGRHDALLTKVNVDADDCSGIGSAAQWSFERVCDVSQSVSMEPKRGTAITSSAGSSFSQAIGSEVSADVEARRDAVLREMSDSRSFKRYSCLPQLTGPIAEVRSPDWSALEVMHGGASQAPRRLAGLYRYRCSNAEFDRAIKVARRSRACQRRDALQAQRWPSAKMAQLADPETDEEDTADSSAQSFQLAFSERTSIITEEFVAASAAAEARCCTAWPPLSHRSGAPRHSAEEGARFFPTSGMRQPACAAEVVLLRPRIAVAPFVIEAFGKAHRYRPLAQLPHCSISGRSQTSEATYRMSSSSARRDDLREAMEHSVELSDSDARVPWRHPAVANELVSPRTGQYFHTAALRHIPVETASENDAGFIHCALRRSYDAGLDQFTYMNSPDMVTLLFTRFSTVAASLTKRLRESSPVRRVSTPVMCAGDLLGSFADLMVLLGNVSHFSHWSAMHTPLLLLGNYVDVGWHSVEVMMLLCCWAYLQPRKVLLLRGPHEDPVVNGNEAKLGRRCLRYKCRQRFGARRGAALWQQFNAVFSVLPVAAVVDGEVFAAHGGVPRLHVSRQCHGGSGIPRGSPYHHVAQHGRRSFYSHTSGTPTPSPSGAVAMSLSAEGDVPASLRLSPRWSTMDRRFAVSDAAADTAKKEGRTAAPPLFYTQRTSHSSHAETSIRASLPPFHVVDSLDGDGGSQITPSGLATAFSSFSPSFSSCEVSRRGLKEAHDVFCSSPSPRPVGETYVHLRLPLSTGGRSPSLPSSRGGGDREGNSDHARTDTSSKVSVALTGLPEDSRLSFDAFSFASRASDVEVVPRALHAPQDFSTSASSFSTSGGDERQRWQSVAQHSGNTATEASNFSHNRNMLPKPVAAASGMEGEPDEENAPTGSDFSALLCATNMVSYAFPSLWRCAPDEGQEVRRRRRLVRELLWNRPRNAATALLPSSDETTVAEDGETDEEPQMLWWRPRTVEGCGVCPAYAPHACCHTFGSTALMNFLRQYNYAMLIRGSPDDASEFYGIFLSEDGRQLALNSCTRQRKVLLQAGACVMGNGQLRLAVWGPRELADSVCRESLISFASGEAADTRRVGFEQFVCDVVQSRLRRKPDTGAATQQWSVKAAYEEYQRCGAAVNS